MVCLVVGIALPRFWGALAERVEVIEIGRLICFGQKLYAPITAVVPAEGRSAPLVRSRFAAAV